MRCVRAGASVLGEILRAGEVRLIVVEKTFVDGSRRIPARGERLHAHLAVDRLSKGCIQGRGSGKQVRAGEASAGKEACVGALVALDQRYQVRSGQACQHTATAEERCSHEARWRARGDSARQLPTDVICLPMTSRVSAKRGLRTETE